MGQQHGEGQGGTAVAGSCRSWPRGPRAGGGCGRRVQRQGAGQGEAGGQLGRALEVQAVLQGCCQARNVLGWGEWGELTPVWAVCMTQGETNWGRTAFILEQAFVHNELRKV